jgi:hypothetical protein
MAFHNFRDSWTEFWAAAANRIRRTADALDDYSGAKHAEPDTGPADDPTGQLRAPWWVTAVVILLAAVGISAVAALIWAVVELLAALVQALASLVQSLVTMVGDGVHAGRWTAHRGGLLAVVSNPVQHYLTIHAAGLPASAQTLWDGWLTAGAVLLVLAVIGSWPARIGWILFGAASAGMVYAGTPANGRDLSAAVAVIGWALLSVFAFRGLYLFRPRFINIENPAPKPADVNVTVPAPTIKRIDVDINGRQISTVDESDDK